MSDTAATSSDEVELVNELPEVEVNTYDSEYLAELYDAFWDSIGYGNEDTATYWNVLQQQLKVTKHDRLVVLDVGTGTGRIINNLANWSPGTEDEDLSRVDFIGLELSTDMLEKARNTAIDTQKIGSITWIQGDYFDLPSSLPSGCKVDLMIMGQGTISHLADAADLDKLFAGTKKVLQPGTGRFYISLLDSATGDAANDLIPLETTETQLLSDPDLFVRETIRSCTIDDDGKLSSNSQTLVIRRDKANNRNVVIANYSVNFTMGTYGIDTLKDAATRKGLRVADEVRSPHQTYLGVAS